MITHTSQHILLSVYIYMVLSEIYLFTYLFSFKDDVYDCICWEGCEWVPMGTKASDPPAAEITGSHGLSDVGAGN